MSAGNFPSAGDGISDALAGFASAEIGDPWDVQEVPRALAAWMADVSYTLRRSAERLEETGIHPAVIDSIRDAAGMAGVAAGNIEHLTGFSLARGFA